MNNDIESLLKTGIVVQSLLVGLTVQRDAAEAAALHVVQLKPHQVRLLRHVFRIEDEEWSEGVRELCKLATATERRPPKEYAGSPCSCGDPTCASGVQS